MSALLKLLILILQIPMKPKSWKFGLLRNKIINIWQSRAFWDIYRLATAYW